MPGSTEAATFQTFYYMCMRRCTDLATLMPSFMIRRGHERADIIAWGGLIWVHVRAHMGSRELAVMGL